MLIQLFERRRRTAPLRGHGIARMTEREWAECGSPIPCGLREIEARGRFRDTPAGRLMIVSVRLREAVDFDIGFTPRISYFDSPDTASFVSFGNGMLPAELAPPGAVFTFAVPVAGRMKSFRLDCSRCGDAGQEL